MLLAKSFTVPVEPVVKPAAEVTHQPDAILLPWC